MRTRITLALFGIPLILGTACSSGSDDECNRLQSKLDSCGVTLAAGSTLVCDSNDAEAECKIHCLMNAACGDLMPTKKDDPFVTCERDCYLLGPDPFTCDDLRGYLPHSQVCDGKKQCPDGSDEKGCSDAGVTDGGRDSGDASPG